MLELKFTSNNIEFARSIAFNRTMLELKFLCDNLSGVYCIF